MGDAHDLTLLDMRELLESLERDATEVRERLWIETYIVKGDAFGRRLADWMRAAAARGADARLLYDASGSHEAADVYFDRLRAGGVQVRAYGRGAFLGLLRPGVRDHSRIVVADRTAYTGGHAFARDWLPRDAGGDGWHDTAVRIQGPVCAELRALFEQRWREADGAPTRDWDTGERFEDVRLVGDGPRGRSPVLRAYLDAFRRARRRIWIANAYFFPPRPFRREIFDAAARGVAVKVLVPSAGHHDLPIIGRAAWREYDGWLRRGLDIREFEGAMMHAKYAVVDDGWCAVGTYNATAAAIRLTVELLLCVRAPRFVAEVARQFEADLTRSRRITRALVRARPWRERVLDRLAHGVMATSNLALGRAR